LPLEIIDVEETKMDIIPPFSSTVKEYTLENYVYDDDGKAVLDNKFTWKYNLNHQISEVIQYDSNNELSEISHYTYDDGQKLKEVEVKVAEGEQKKVLLYDYKDNVLEQITELAGDYKTVTKYDDYGSPSEKLTFTRADLLIATTVFINLYDQNGRLVEKHTIFPSNDSECIDKFQYDEAGRLIEEQKTRSQFVSIARHTYNDKGDLILSEFNPGQPNYETIKREFLYSLNNDILEVKEYRKGWCYQDRNDEFGLTGIARYSYIR
jgi:hypothetical protein